MSFFSFLHLYVYLEGYIKIHYNDDPLAIIVGKYRNNIQINYFIFGVKDAKTEFFYNCSSIEYQC